MAAEAQRQRKRRSKEERAKDAHADLFAGYGSDDSYQDDDFQFPHDSLPNLADDQRESELFQSEVFGDRFELAAAIDSVYEDLSESWQGESADHHRQWLDEDRQLQSIGSKEDV